MTPIRNELREFIASIGLTFTEHQLANVFLGYISEASDFGYLLKKLTTDEELFQYLLKLWSANTVQLYLNNYGSMTGHLFWTLATESDVAEMLALRLPKVTGQNSNKSTLSILSLSCTCDSADEIRRDVQHLARTMDSDIFYVRRRQKNVLAQSLNTRKWREKTSAIDIPQKSIPYGLELPVVQQHVQTRLKLGEMLRLYVESGVANKRVRYIERAWRPLTLNQFTIAYDTEGKPEGLVSWAWVSQDESESFLSNPFEGHLSRWRRGEQLIVVDKIGRYNKALTSASQLGLL